MQQQRKYPSNGHGQLAAIDSRIEEIRRQIGQTAHTPEEPPSPSTANDDLRASFLSPIGSAPAPHSPTTHSFERLISPHDTTPKISCSTPLGSSSSEMKPLSPSSALASSGLGSVYSKPPTAFPFDERLINCSRLNTYSSVLPGAGNIFSPLLSSSALDQSGEPEPCDPVDERIRQLDAEIMRGKTRPPVDYSKFRIRRKNDVSAIAANTTATSITTATLSPLNPLTVSVPSAISPQAPNKSPPVKSEDTSDFIKSMLSSSGGSDGIKKVELEMSSVDVSRASSTDLSQSQSLHKMSPVKSILKREPVVTQRSAPDGELTHASTKRAHSLSEVGALKPAKQPRPALDDTVFTSTMKMKREEKRRKKQQEELITSPKSTSSRRESTSSNVSKEPERRPSKIVPAIKQQLEMPKAGASITPGSKSQNSSKRSSKSDLLIKVISAR
ncbi:hypothetical protein Ciccas_004736 [Cichlidogyrus casuarinus]|uniref:Uncharacterized protein n=1 Tax=Cichlidogyrus casuarinus TaxID=1844966 RepID=A0ABD2QB38_9PLAT